MQIYSLTLDGSEVLYDENEIPYPVIDPKASLSTDAAGTLEFSLPMEHPLYAKVTLNLSTVILKEADKYIFYGRVYQVNMDFNNIKRITCEGALAFLNDEVCPEAESFESVSTRELFRTLVGYYNNAQTNKARKLYIGKITARDVQAKVDINYDNVYEAIKNLCVKSAGGYLSYRYENNKLFIDWTKDLGSKNEKSPIEFGVNLLDLKQESNIDNVITGIVATCTYEVVVYDADTGEYIETVNDTMEEIVTSASMVKKYGYIYEHVDFIARGNGVDNIRANLRSDATEYLTAIEFDGFYVDVSAADEYIFKRDNEPFKLGEQLHIVSSPHMVDTYIPITKIEINLLTGEKRIGLGKTFKKAFTQKIDSMITKTEAPPHSLITDAYVEITKEPTKTEFFVGEQIDYTGIKIYYIENDGEAEDITEHCSFSILEGTTVTTSMWELGELEVEATYNANAIGNLTARFFIKTLRYRSIYVATNPTKTVYSSGDELDLSGIVVKATYKDYEDTISGEKDITSSVTFDPANGYTIPEDADSVTDTITFNAPSDQVYSCTLELTVSNEPYGLYDENDKQLISYSSIISKYGDEYKLDHTLGDLDSENTLYKDLIENYYPTTVTFKFPNYLEQGIRGYALNGCYMLKHVGIPAFINTYTINIMGRKLSGVFLDNGVFKNCTSLEEVILTNFLYVGTSTGGREGSPFRGCSSLKLISYSILVLFLRPWVLNSDLVSLENFVIEADYWYNFGNPLGIQYMSRFIKDSATRAQRFTDDGVYPSRTWNSEFLYTY